MSEEKFVVDTSAFMTEGARKEGESMAEAVERILDLFETAEGRGHRFYMPSSTFEELREILEGSVSDATIKKLNARVRKRDPARYEVNVSGEFLHEFIDEMRERVDRGLRLSEKAVREVEEMEEDPDHEHYDKSDVVISDLRDDYKEALRKGILDSREDLDLLLLGRELDAAVVSEDRGVLRWAGEFGLRQIEGSDFPGVLEELTD
ncbi:MAG: RNA ligase partner protein [Candidatus Nanohaloarchaea archaeon]